MVEDVIYLGTHTKYWVRADEYRLSVEQQHNRFVLDEQPIRWKDEVWIQWHADDGFMLERYAERDEALMGTPAAARRRGRHAAAGGRRMAESRGLLERRHEPWVTLPSFLWLVAAVRWCRR